jgi:hypothetical protein
MPIRSKITILTVLAGIGVGYLASFASQRVALMLPSKGNVIASSSISKRNLASDPRFIRAQGKHLKMVEIELYPQTDLPEDEDMEVVINAKIKLLQSIQGDLRYKWILPEGVHLVDGILEDGLAGVRPGQTVDLSISVTGFHRNENRLIIMQAFNEDFGTKLGGAQVLASKPAETLENVAPIRAQVVREHNLNSSNKTANLNDPNESPKQE